MTEAERKQIEKEIQGLRARLRWDHVTDGIRETYQLRIAELEAKLKSH